MVAHREIKTEKQTLCIQISNRGIDLHKSFGNANLDTQIYIKWPKGIASRYKLDCWKLVFISLSDQ